MAQQNDRKILRIGIIQNGKIIEERLLRKREPVTIGQSPRNTFVLPTAPFARSHALFDLKGGVYHLNFKDNMDGRVSIEDAVLDFKGIVNRKLADKKGEFWALPLSEKSRGKVVIGDVTMLFQFVAPPPPPSRLQLPANVKGGWRHSVDWPFSATLTGSLVLQVAVVVAVITMDVPEKPKGLEQLPDRIAQIISQPKPPKPKEEEKKEEEAEKKEEEAEKPKVAEKPKEPPKPRDTTPKPEEKEKPAPPPEDAAARAERIKKEVASKTIISQLGAGVGSGGSIVDSLRDAKAEVATAAAFDGATGVALADNDSKDKDRRAGRVAATGTVAGLTDSELAVEGGTGSVDTGTKAPEVKATVKAAQPSEAFGTGTLDTNKIADTVRKRIGAVKACYEKELKKNPKLEGKIVVQFTINEGGRVEDTTIKSDSIGEAAVGECIMGAIKKWPFARPEGGSVTVAFPFIFAPSN